MSGADPIGRKRRTEQQAAVATPLPRALLLIGVVMAVVGSVGGPLITSVATTLHVSLAAAQWTLTVSLLTGAVATPVLGRLGSGARRRRSCWARSVSSWPAVS